MSSHNPNFGTLASAYDASFLYQGDPASLAYTNYDIMDGCKFES